MPIFSTNYVIYFSILALIPFGIIIVTSIWTFVFTRAFLKRDLQRQTDFLNREHMDAQKSVYTERMRNLVGIFGALLVCNLLTLSPYIAASLVGFVIGFENLPAELYASVFIVYLLTTVTNPVIQVYFRKDLLDCVKGALRRLADALRRLSCCHQGRVNGSSHTAEGQGSQCLSGANEQQCGSNEQREVNTIDTIDASADERDPNTADFDTTDLNANITDDNS